jgi:hypothetical protein
VTGVSGSGAQQRAFAHTRVTDDGQGLPVLADAAERRADVAQFLIAADKVRWLRPIMAHSSASHGDGVYCRTA